MMKTNSRLCVHCVMTKWQIEPTGKTSGCNCDERQKYNSTTPKTIPGTQKNDQKKGNIRSRTPFFLAHTRTQHVPSFPLPHFVTILCFVAVCEAACPEFPFQLHLHFFFLPPRFSFDFMMAGFNDRPYQLWREGEMWFFLFLGRLSCLFVCL